MIFSDESQLRRLILSNLGELSGKLSLLSKTTSPGRMGGTTLFRKSILRFFCITRPTSTWKDVCTNFLMRRSVTLFVSKSKETSHELRWCRTPAGQPPAVPKLIFKTFAVHTDNKPNSSSP